MNIHEFKYHLVILGALSFSGCKTAEQIQREKMVDSLSQQMNQSQHINADYTVRLSRVEDKVTQLTGAIEETAHKSEVTHQSKLKTIEEDMKVLHENYNTNSERLAEIEKSLAEQKKYLDQVLSSLSGLSKGGGKGAKASKASAKGAEGLSPYDQATEDYKKGKYADAKGIYLELVEDKKIKGDKKARIIHNLGMIEYMNKNYDTSMVYFSKLFTEYPDAPFNPNGLLYIGKAFQNKKDFDQAKQTFQELIKRYPKSKQVKEAQKLLAQLEK